MFDFTKMSEEEINDIPNKKVVIPNYNLVQNITPKSLGARMAVSMAGLPTVPMDEADFLPEGLVNTSGFPFVGNSIDLWDPKIGFDFRSVVYDDGNFFQWVISQKKELPDKHYHWYKSDICNLEKFLPLYEKIQEFRNSPLIKNPTTNFINQVSDAYNKLEVLRQKYRAQILDYHNTQKNKFDLSLATVPTPPELSYLDAIKYTKDGYQIKTHMESLFLRSAIRNLLKAQTAKRLHEDNSDNYAMILDEIEYSATSIIASTNCLETYINTVISKYLPSESTIFNDASSHRQKWLWVPAALELTFRFKPEEYPFNAFSNLVKWRNNAIHHKAEYTRPRGSVSHTYNQFNAQNAEIGIKVIKDIVSKLSEDGVIPLPVWIRSDVANSDYWNEVKNYLSTI